MSVEEMGWASNPCLFVMCAALIEAVTGDRKEIGLVLQTNACPSRHFEPASGSQPVLSTRSPLNWRNKHVFPAEAKRLSVQLYRSLEDGVVLDWFISLIDKDNMRTCDIFYALANETDDGIHMAPFMPVRRTFVIAGLRANSTYDFVMQCRDRHEQIYLSDNITFVTGLRGSGRALGLDRFGSRDRDPLLDALKEADADFAEERSGFDLRKELRRRNISPHAVLGTACLALGLLIALITTALVLGRHWRSQQRMRATAMMIDSGLNNHGSDVCQATMADVCIGSVRQYLEVSLLQMPSWNNYMWNQHNNNNNNNECVDGLELQPRALLAPDSEFRGVEQEERI